ncbi:ATP-binding protein [Haematobacter massiliensis]|uniref:ATP-binding protein n=1 Tax=Haematobacter massiliensis TaxID=195105 RepID=A0A086Y5M8_9RHOB|nr:ATP-binding protein [Haematobacter massiliensis]KFI29578.1 ATP-binding protein [Haematobacter massiliensis]OWJ73041.1 ATP-binding protein [Haematobacter massiliensis]OWJ88289.1 ATP-binding protein [Haematobacter massiliensis]QBJ25644.1 ATP-binding protein [Haematobacter massiliensis]
MAILPFSRLRASLGVTALILATAANPALADTIFTPSADGFAGMVRAASDAPGSAILKGGKVRIAGDRLIPGQEITLLRGPTVLNTDGPIIVDAEGKFSFDLTLDADAVTGLQPIVVIAEKPAAATVVELKISPDVPVSGKEKFAIESGLVTRGLYQVAHSDATDAVFVTSAIGRPPVKDSALLKIDAKTLEVQAQVAPPAAPARADGSDGGVFAVYGVAVDDRNGNVWVTNTRQNTVAVYQQSDLSLVKQFEPGAVAHARDVVIDEANSRAYASATGTGNIEVFDTKTLEQLDPIVVQSGKRGGDFSVMSLDIDTEGGTLVTVSMLSDEAAVVTLATGETKVFPLPGARSASGVAFDAKDGLIFVASQQTDNLLIANTSGEVLHDVEVGAGALNVAFDPVNRLAYVANRGAGTITVVDTDGKIVANLDAGSMPNQLRADGKGNIYAVNKSRGENDPVGDRIWRITPATH